MYTLIVKASFEAAHSLPDHPGKCKALHGHSYHVEAEFVSATVGSNGMVHDFGSLKDALKSVLPDHVNLDDVMNCPSTAENIARMLYNSLKMTGLPVSAVTVWETDKYGCRYSE